MKVGIKLNATFKNHNMMKKRIELGYLKFMDFVRAFNERYASDVSYNYLLSLENMHHCPSDDLAIKISEFLDIPIEDVFPIENKRAVSSVKKINKTIYKFNDAIYQSLEDRSKPEFLINDLRDALSKQIDNLYDHEKKIINLRFYENKTLSEIANQFKVTPERIRMIEQKALLRLRKRKDNLIPFIQ